MSPIQSMNLRRGLPFPTFRFTLASYSSIFRYNFKIQKKLNYTKWHTNPLLGKDFAQTLFRFIKAYTYILDFVK